MITWRPFLLALGLACGLLAADAMPPVAHAQQLVPTTGKPIELDVNKGVLIRLEHDADTIFVADTTIADVKVKSPRIVYLFAKAPGQTSLYAVDSHQNILMGRTIDVRRDIGRLQAALTALLPNSRLTVDSVDGTLVVAGQVASPLEAEEVKRISRPFVTDDKQFVDRVKLSTPDQVNLRVRVAEVSHDVIKELGINWDAIQHAGNFAFGLALGVNPATSLPGATGFAPGLAAAGAAALTGGGNFVTQPQGLEGVAQNSFFGGYNSAHTNANAMINALDQHGLIRILAEPNLTAVSGETASFLAGGEFPIIVPQTLGQVTVEFKQFGVALSFTPVVLDDGRISLKVRPEVSQLSTTGAVQLQGFSIPSLTTRRAETTVELGSGQTFAIGGLLQNNITDTLQKVPGLGDLPVLGPLFRSDAFQKNETELVILVTPYLVRPVSDKRLALPGQSMSPASDINRILQGVASKSGGSIGAPAPVGPNGDRLVGPAGFVLN